MTTERGREGGGGRREDYKCSGNLCEAYCCPNVVMHSTRESQKKLSSVSKIKSKTRGKV